MYIGRIQYGKRPKRKALTMYRQVNCIRDRPQTDPREANIMETYCNK